MRAPAPRLLVAAPRSGGGKTTFVCGLLRALQRRGLRPAAFKCGPDYIDPLFHSEVLGARSGNLDLFFTPEQTVRALLLEGSRGCDLSVLEGVMGYYDGLGGTTDRASAWHLASATETPAVLLVDARGTSVSLCALVSGFLAFRPDSRIRAVLLNRCTAMQYALVKPLIERQCGVPVLGFLPNDEAFSLESRHLGLVTAAEVEHLLEKLDRIADSLEQNADIPALLALAASAPELEAEPPALPERIPGEPVIAVARDRAFCFYYRENLALLEKLGARLREFSPIEDAALPGNASALYLGGGYPELWAGALSRNESMRRAVRAAAEAGMPVFAECGGFLYLLDALAEPGGQSYPMAGVLPGEGWYTGKLRRFGYVTLTAEEDTLLLKKGEQLPAHEFHYYEAGDCGRACTARKALRETEWPCVQAAGRVFAGFPHLYFYALPAAAARFVQAAKDYREGR